MLNGPLDRRHVGLKMYKPLPEETPMIDKKFAESFAQEWIDAWNSHDLDRVLSHYTDNFEMSSPFIISISGESSGMLKGQDAVGKYWAKALQLNPQLRFELESVLMGVGSVTLYYKGTRGMAAEVFHFDSERKVVKAFAHYAG